MKKYFSICFIFLLGISSVFAQNIYTLQLKIEQIIEDLKTSEQRGYALLPLESKLIKIEQRDQHVKILLEIPISFLETELDDLLIDEIVENLVSPLSEFGIFYVSILSKNRENNYVELSYFLNNNNITFTNKIPNHDPAIMREGNATRKSLDLKNSVHTNGLLSGKTVWLSAGHGWKYDPRNKTFNTQRRNTFGVVEDFASVEFVNYYLLKYLQQAGANVWTVRERDMNENELIVDNDDAYPNYQEKGKWFTSRTSGYNGKSYRYALSQREETSSAIFQTTIPKSGKYWVSVRYLDGINRVTDARYRIYHAGGISEASINQETHGNTWVYLGQFYFEKGARAKVELLNKSQETGQAVIADAVRFGGGIGHTPDCRTGQKSREPRFEEAAKYYARFQGYPSCANDVIIRPLYAEWELSKGTISERRNAIYISLHTNGSAATGTESYIHNFKPVRGSRTLQQYIHKELIQDIRRGWNPSWKDRGQKAADFGELRNLRTMPGVLLELAFHDNAKDAIALTTPAFRELAARAIYKGIVRYFAKRDGIRPVFLPEKPTELAAINKGLGMVSLSWKAPKYAGIFGDSATKYKVFISQNGRGFADYEMTTRTSFVFRNLMPNTNYYFRVVAINEGGESFPTAVVALRTPDPQNESVHYLIVDGFDRLERSQAVVSYEAMPRFAPLGKVRRLFLEQMNDYSYAVDHAVSLGNSGIYFDGITNEALIDRKTKLENYDGIDWFLGRESTTDETLSDRERALLKMYLDQGGKLIISGSEIGYDLWEKGNGKSFYKNYLKANYKGDNADSYKFIGRSTSKFHSINGNFNKTNTKGYFVNSPDYIKAVMSAEVLLKYGNGKTAAVGYDGKFGLVHFAFPIEMIADEKIRTALLARSLEYLHPAYIHHKPKPLKKEVMADAKN